MTLATPDRLSDGFKDAMRRLASTVAIITTCEGDTWHGMAATAVTSVSTNPPCLLIAVNRTASLHAPVTASRRFCVNLLDVRHNDLVHIFSGALKGAERFRHGDWTQHDGGLPFLRGSAASLFCDLEVELDHATHTLFIGAITGVLTDSAADPLVWADGRTARLSAL
jgi:flavin reductase